MDNKRNFSSCCNAAKNMTTHQGQGSGDNQSEPHHTDIAKLLSIAAVIVILNSLVFYLFLKKKTLRTTSNSPLFSLAVCDFFSGSVVIPLFTILYFTPLVPSQRTLFYLGFLVTVLHNFVAILSVYHIVIVTAERYLAIKFPLKHLALDQKSVNIVLALVWLFSLLISLVPFTWINKMYPVFQPVSLKFTLVFTIFCMVFVLVLPYIFLVYAFIDMFKAVYGGSRNRHREDNGFLRHTEISKRRSTGERKCLMLFVIMASVFLVCWLPWFVVFLLYQLQLDFSKLKVPSQVSLLIRYMSSAVNPLLYTFLKRDFNQTLKFVFSRKRQVSILFTRQSRGTLQSNSSDPPTTSLQRQPGRRTSVATVLRTIEECEEHLYESALWGLLRLYALETSLNSAFQMTSLVWIKVNYGELPEVGGWGCAARFPIPFPYLWLKSGIFPALFMNWPKIRYTIYDLTLKSIPCFRPAL